MKARSPLDNLGQLLTKLPETQLKVGMKIDPKKLDMSYARKQILRQLITDTRSVLNKLVKKGYIGDFYRIPDGNKKQIRQTMWVIDNAYEAEVVGILPFNMHLNGHIANQCYIQGVPGAASGTTYYAILMFRAVLNDDRQNKVAIIPANQKLCFHESQILKGIKYDT